jgi:hypothetical protein
MNQRTLMQKYDSRFRIDPRTEVGGASTASYSGKGSVSSALIRQTHPFPMN